MILETIVSGLFLASTYALAAFGLAIVFGVLHILNFAHGALLLSGAYIAVEFVERGFNFFVALVLATAVIAGIGLFLERFLFRQVQHEHIAGLIVSIGLIAIAESIHLETWGPGQYNLPRLINGSFRIAGAIIPKDRLLIILIAAVSLSLAQLGINRTGWGKLLRATAEDHDAAVLQGVPVSRVQALAFAAGAALAAFAGIILGTTIPVEPALGESILIKAFIVIIIGGAGSTTGALVGALILGMTEAVGIVYLSTASAQLVPLLVLGAILMLRPQGMLGKASVRV